MPKVFIIILNWNNWPDVLECLTSLQNNDYPNYQVVIVDNGSSLRPEAPGGVKVIYNSKNLGFAGGNNLGIKYLLQKNCQQILILNNDIDLHPDSIALLLKAVKCLQLFPQYRPHHAGHVLLEAHDTGVRAVADTQGILHKQL